MKKQEYAIVDIETTGGNTRYSRITEIAIIIFDGKKVIERWETLINPEKNIPLPIFALTGINNKMVLDAPIFDDVAKTIFEMLTNRIFVAHNVNFDYSFVRHQLEESGFKWTARKLCTVRATRKIRPGLPSYSLGNLCRSLDIKLINQHRAGGDAAATAILLSKLFEWDVDAELSKMIKNTAQDQRLPPNLPPADFENLPEKTGVYYFYNSDKQVIYIGKAINIKKRVASHFTGNNINAQRQNFLKDIHNISSEICATELMALLLECTEINKLWPKYNRALKRFEPKFGLHSYEARNGYKYLAVGKLSKFQTCVESFNNIYEGINTLRHLTMQFDIDTRFCNFGINEFAAFVQEPVIKDLPQIEYHNAQVENALEYITANKQSFAIIDKGRVPNEQSCIWVEKGHFYGMGHITPDIVINTVEDLKEYVTPYRSNAYIMQLIKTYKEKHPYKVKQIEN